MAREKQLSLTDRLDQVEASKLGYERSLQVGRMKELAKYDSGELSREEKRKAAGRIVIRTVFDVLKDRGYNPIKLSEDQQLSAYKLATGVDAGDLRKQIERTRLLPAEIQQVYDEPDKVCVQGRVLAHIEGSSRVEQREFVGDVLREMKDNYGIKVGDAEVEDIMLKSDVSGSVEPIAKAYFTLNALRGGVEQQEGALEQIKERYEGMTKRVEKLAETEEEAMERLLEKLDRTTVAANGGARLPQMEGQVPA